jgi:hypothetical protein
LLLVFAERKILSLFKTFTSCTHYTGYSFKFIPKVGVEQSIVNAPFVSRGVKTQTTQKVRLDLNSLSVICNPWCDHNRFFKAYFEDTHPICLVTADSDKSTFNSENLFSEFVFYKCSGYLNLFLLPQ